MPEVIYASTNDGYQASGLNASCDNAHDAVGQNQPDINNSRDTINGVRYEIVTRFGTQYYLTRSFFDFDTSAIDIKPSAASFYFTSYSNAAATPCIIAKSGHDPSTATDDWFSTWITGQSVTLSGWGSSDIYFYAASTAIGSTNAFTSFTLNEVARSDIASLSTFKICVLHTNDYNDTAPTSGTLRTGMYWTEYGGATRPNILYTPGVVTADNATFFGANF